MEPRKWVTVQAACVFGVMCLFVNNMVYAADSAANKGALKPACKQPAPLQGQFNPKAPRYIVSYKVNVQDPAKETEALVNKHHFLVERDLPSVKLFFVKELTPQQLAALRCEPSIAYIEFDATATIMQ